MKGSFLWIHRKALFIMKWTPFGEFYENFVRMKEFPEREREREITWYLNSYFRKVPKLYPEFISKVLINHTFDTILTYHQRDLKCNNKNLKNVFWNLNQRHRENFIFIVEGRYSRPDYVNNKLWNLWFRLNSLDHRKI